MGSSRFMGKLFCLLVQQLRIRILASRPSILVLSIRDTNHKCNSHLVWAKLCCIQHIAGLQGTLVGLNQLAHLPCSTISGASHFCQQGQRPFLDGQRPNTITKNKQTNIATDQTQLQSCFGPIVSHYKAARPNQTSPPKPSPPKLPRSAISGASHFRQQGQRPSLDISDVQKLNLLSIVYADHSSLER